MTNPLLSRRIGLDTMKFVNVPDQYSLIYASALPVFSLRMEHIVGSTCPFTDVESGL